MMGIEKGRRIHFFIFYMIYDEFNSFIEDQEEETEEEEKNPEDGEPKDDDGSPDDEDSEME